MSLTSALAASRSALFAFGTQTGVISRNISNVANDDATRKLAPLVTTNSTVSVAGITRATNTTLFNSNLEALGRAGSSEVVADALDRLDILFGDPESARSPAALIGRLRDAIDVYAQQPNNTVMASTVVSAAVTLTGTLNHASSEVQAVRVNADNQIASAVESVNANLTEIHELTASIREGTIAGRDVTNLMDQRDVRLKAIATEIDITWTLEADNDIQIQTGSGITLYDRVPRTVRFEASNFLNATTDGGALYIDEVQVSGDSSPMPLFSGRISGLLSVRDDLGPSLQRQLDEVARGLVYAFAESDQSAVPSLPDQAGLLTWTGGPGLPPAAGITDGLAAQISVNDNVSAADGPAAVLLRDGSISNPGNPAYQYNPSGFESFADRLLEMADALEMPQSFSASAGLSTSTDVTGFATDMTSWFGAARSNAKGEFEFLEVQLVRTTQALSNATGVNLDEELARMLQLERSYQASAKVISVVDELLGYLIEAAG